MKDEPRISINGAELSVGQAMTIRVAIESFAADLVDEGLGDDEHGKKMTDAYLQNIAAIRKLMFKEGA